METLHIMSLRPVASRILFVLNFITGTEQNCWFILWNHTHVFVALEDIPDLFKPIFIKSRK